MEVMVNGDAATDSGPDDQAVALCTMYDRALPEVYGYLVHRCGAATVAEDLTSETFMAAVDAVRRGRVPNLTVAWLIGVARHKLVDHWRRQAREEAKVSLVADADSGAVDDWDERLDVLRAQGVLAGLAPHHRVALTLRYLDGLPVPEVAELLDRTVHATEALLVRARVAFRRAYGEEASRA
jgi:RNA polymerase sigma-70 factor (ECF subfamily)